MAVLRRRWKALVCLGTRNQSDVDRERQTTGLHPAEVSTARLPRARASLLVTKGIATNGARTLRTGLLALLLGARTLRTGLLALLLVTRSYYKILRRGTARQSTAFEQQRSTGAVSLVEGSDRSVYSSDASHAAVADGR